MAFPDQWMQSWHYLSRAPSPYSSLLFWWHVNGAFVDTFPNRLALHAALSAWNASHLVGAQYTNFHGQNGGPSYMNMGSYYFTVAAPGILDTIVPHILPASQSVVVQLHTGNFTRSGRGRLHIGQIPTSFVNEGHLTNAGITHYQNLVDTWTDTFSAGGATFSFALVSYKDATIVPVTKFVVNSKIGCLHRRAKSYRAFPFLAGPKVPPP